MFEVPSEPSLELKEIGYECSIHGPLKHTVDINIKDFESVNGKYCLVCIAKFLSENFPRMKAIK